MQSHHRIISVAFSLWLVLQVCIAGAVNSAEKVSATVLAKDSLTAPREEARIEARVLGKGLLHDTPLGGEPVELVLNGKTAATGMTGGDGRAVLSLVPTTRGIVPLEIRVGTSPRVSAAEGHANLVVWDRRTPILAVELSALMEEPRSDGLLPGIGPALQHEVKPMADAADELAKLSQFYYGLMYVTTVPSGADGFAIHTDARNWLASHKFPPGFVITLPSGDDALGVKLDELHGAGWKSIKIGIGRSKAFAETFLRRRLEAILIPEPLSDTPRKAKVAKDWKEVRKKL